MMKMLHKLAPLRRDKAGSVVIESAFVIPVLAVMALGGFEASRIVSRQVELQTAASEAAAIVLANVPDEVEERNTIRSIVRASTDLDVGQVTLVVRYRCDSAAVLVVNNMDCDQTGVISEFIVLTLTDTYTPIWSSFGIGDDVNYRVRRRVQIA